MQSAWKLIAALLLIFLFLSIVLIGGILASPVASAPHELGVLFEETERGPQQPFDLGPALAGPDDRVLDEGFPVGERVEEHLAVERVLRGVMVEQARPADPDLVGDLVEARARVPVLCESPLGHPEDDLLRGRHVSGVRAGAGESHDPSLPTCR